MTCNKRVNCAEDLVRHMNEEGHSLDAACPTKTCGQRIPVLDMKAHYEKCIVEWYKRKNKVSNAKNRRIAWVCEVCGKKFQWKGKYELHLASHKDGKDMPEEPSEYFCEICGKVFDKRANLKTHHNTMHDQSIKCKLCDFSCGIMSIMTKHMVRHQEPRFKCATCGKMFKSKLTLVAHEREHAGILPSECNVCGKGFTSRLALGQHKRLVHKIAGPGARPSKRERERGITGFKVG